jgi:GNAT superfamily N-acetyltransferase
MGTLVRGATIEPVRLFDGTPAALRPITPSDAAALSRFHSHLSDATIRMRFFSLHLELTVDEVERFTTVDGTDRVALVVTTPTDLIAVGRYDRGEDPTTAEVAFVVADPYQHHGLGSLLLHRLAERARAAGIRTFVAETLIENSPMLGVFRESGYPMHSKSSLGVVDVTLDITNAA